MKIDDITIANQEKGMALHRFRLHQTVNTQIKITAITSIRIDSEVTNIKYLLCK